MAGVQKLFYLPEPHTDFIFAVIGEELGLLGATAVLVCFCVIAWRGLRIALRAPGRFGAFLALGLTAMIAAQAFINISVVLGLLPTKGIPLPLVSSGGSSLLVNLLGMGILLNISQHETPWTDDGVDRRRRRRGGATSYRVVHRRRRDGGHLYPGIAVARELLARVPDAGDVRRHGRRYRGARGAARGLRARPDPERGAEGQVAGVAACAGLRCCR